MSTALATRSTVQFGLVNGQERQLDHIDGAALGVYLKALNVEIGDAQTAVIGGMPATTSTIVPKNAAVTITERPKNG